MTNMFLTGETIYLRPLVPQDANDNYVSWLNDGGVCEFNSHHTFPYTTEMARQYIAQITGSKTEVVLAVIDKQSDSHIGNVALQNISWINRSAEFAILIGNSAFHGKGVGEEAGGLLIAHGFGALNLHRIHCGTSADNVAMQKLAEKLGMSEEGRRRDAMYKNGAYADVIEYGLVREA